MRTVYLHLIDGFEFEKLVGEIFRLHGFSVIDVQATGDAGRDLILEKDGNRTIVECKHQKGSVGRPVIQKLHSAVVVDHKAERGIVVTTGRFSKQAQEYVKQQNIPIELVDLPSLRRLAAQVDMELLLKGEKASQKVYSIHKRELTFKNITDVLSKKLESYPASLEEIFKQLRWSVNLLPAYRIRYRIDHTTKNTVGDILYDVHESGIMHLKADDLKETSSDINEYFRQTRSKNFFIQPRALEALKPPFIYDVSSASKKGKDDIISNYAINVIYRGRNNIRYERLCKPKSKDILISNIVPIYIPYQKILLGVIKNNYNFEILENQTFKPLVLKSNINKCSICGSEIENKGILCNSCGNITHEPSWWRRGSHGYRCDDCGKTICRDCGFWRRKWLFMKQVVCEECAEKEKKAGKKVDKIPPLKGSE